MVRTICTASHRLRSGTLCALLALLATSTKGAHAQMQGAGGHWQFTYTRTDTAAGSAYLPGLPPISWNTTQVTAAGGKGFPSSLDPYTTFANNVQGMVHIKAVWMQNVPYPGLPQTPPPAYLTLIFTPQAKWDFCSYDPTKDIVLYDHGADDGFGDAENVTMNIGKVSVPGPGRESRGLSAQLHLRTYAASSGTVEDDINQNVRVSLYAPGGGAGALEIDLTADVDDRNVVVTSSADTTFSRAIVANNPTRIPNIPDNTGVIRGDMKSPAPAFNSISAPYINLNYHASVSGHWNDNTSYNWYDSISGNSASGTFSSGGSPNDFAVAFNRSQAPPGSSTHGFISVTDGHDNARATGNEYYKFHAAYEDWIRLNDISYPRDITTHPEDWSRLQDVINPGANPMTSVLTQSWTDQVTESGTIGVSVPKIGEGAMAFAANAGITIGKTWTYQVTVGYTFLGDPYSWDVFFVGKTYDLLSGNCSCWGSSGYANDSPWSGVKGSDAWSIQKVIKSTFPHQ